MSSSIGGGNDRGNVKNKKTYLGDDAGRSAGALDQLIQMFMQGANQSQAQNDMLFGGKNYGKAKNFYGQPTPSTAGPGGDAGAGATEGGGSGAHPSALMRATGVEDPPDSGNGGTSGGMTDQEVWANNNPQDFGDQGGNDTPDGGLYGYSQGQIDNPWQTGPNGDAETDVLGSYDWMASGQRNGDENDVYNRMGQFGTEGTPDGTGRTLEGLSSDVNRNLMQGKFNAPQQEANDTYAGIAEGPNAQERSLYGETGKYGSTMGADQGDASGFYRDRLKNGGYDADTQAALTQESMRAARSPFERARDRVIRGAAARGNPASTMGAEISLARDESDAMGSAARQNRIAIAQEAIRQKEGGAQGLMGSQAMTNAQKQFALNAQAGQNAQQAGQRLQGAAGLAQGGNQLKQEQLAGSAANTALANEMAGRRKAGMEMQAGQNAQQRALALEGTKGKQGMFQDMQARKAAGAAMQQHLYDVGQQQRAGDMSSVANVGGKTREDYIESGSGGWGL